VKEGDTLNDEREFQEHKRAFIDVTKELGINIPATRVEEKLRNIQARAQEHGVPMSEIEESNLRRGLQRASFSMKRMRLAALLPTAILNALSRRFDTPGAFTGEADGSSFWMDASYLRWTWGDRIKTRLRKRQGRR